MIFDERNIILLSHRYNFGTCGNRVSTTFWFDTVPSARLRVLCVRAGLLREGIRRACAECCIMLHFVVAVCVLVQSGVLGA